MRAWALRNGGGKGKDAYCCGYAEKGIACYDETNKDTPAIRAYLVAKAADKKDTLQGMPVPAPGELFLCKTMRNARTRTILK